MNNDAMNTNTDPRVSVNFTGLTDYPRTMPFDPSEQFPEYTGKGIDPANHLYNGVRTVFQRLGLDSEHYGSKDWNPLGELIEPGMTVFIKPNTVTEFNYAGKEIFAVINHASIIRALLDYVVIALKGDGRIIIGDSQIINSQFDKAMQVSQIGALIDWYRNQTKIPIELLDLRTVRAVRSWLYGRWGRKQVMQDKRGYTWVDLGDKSHFRDIDPKRLRIGVASYKEMYKHHKDGKHEYLFPNSLLASDVFISIPKLKTHRRTAITVAIKNFMGIPSSKETLPHFIVGSPEEGGDQYIHPSRRKEIGTHLHDIIQSSPYVPVKFVAAVIKKILWNSHLLFPFKDDIYEGMWLGNNSVWRTLLDLNRVIFYADKSGRLTDTQQRKGFYLVDGIIGGDGDGPLASGPVPGGALLAGWNPVAIDAVSSVLMGFDPEKIPLVTTALKDTTGSVPSMGNTFDVVRAIDEDGPVDLTRLHETRNLHFDAHPNWKGYVEYE